MILVPLALAQDDGHPGILLPGAGALEGGKGHVAAGAAFADLYTGEGLTLMAGGPVGTGVVGIGDRVAFNAAVFGGIAEVDPYVGAAAFGAPHAALGARVIAVHLPHLRLAPFAIGAVGFLPDVGFDAAFASGIALKFDLGHVGVDASVPLWGRLWTRGRWRDAAPWRVTEGGVSWQVTPDTRVRFGMASFVPVLTGREEFGPIWLEVDALWFIDGYAMIQVGRVL